MTPKSKVTNSYLVCTQMSNYITSLYKVTNKCIHVAKFTDAFVKYFSILG